MNSHVQAAIANANSAANAITGHASTMIHVPEIEDDPDAVRKLAVATFHLADAIKDLARAIGS